MKKSKKSIGLELIIGFAILLSCPSLSWGQNKAAVVPDTFRQHFIQGIQPYLKSVSWVKELLRVDTSSSFRNSTLKVLHQIDDNWLKTAYCSNKIPEQWTEYWSAYDGAPTYDMLPYYVFHRGQICHVLGFMCKDSIAILGMRVSNYEYEVVVLNKVKSNVTPDEVLLRVQTLIPGFHHEPELQVLHNVELEWPSTFPPQVKGKYFRHAQTKRDKDVFTASITDSTVYALNRWWQILRKSKVSVNYSTCYRIYARDLTTGRPGYFFLKNNILEHRLLGLSLTIERSPLAGREYYFDLGEKNWVDPLKRINQAMKTIKIFAALILLSVIGAFTYASITSQQRRQQRQTQMSLAGLRAQLNPHFLFNTLTSIQDLMNQDNKPAANRYFNEMAQLLRYVVDSSTEEYTSLAAELAALEKYCSLEALRTPFSYEFDLHPDLDLENTEIPTMLLQPFIENAILHGLRPSQGNKHLKISLWPESGDRIGIAIVDDGIGIQESRARQLQVKTKRGHKGINTTLKRIQLINQGKSKKQKIEIKIEDRSQLKPNQTGTEVQLSIPV